MVEQHDSRGVKPVRVPTAMSRSLRVRVVVVAQTEESAREHTGIHEGTQEGRRADAGREKSGEINVL